MVGYILLDHLSHDLDNEKCIGCKDTNQANNICYLYSQLGLNLYWPLIYIVKAHIFNTRDYIKKTSIISQCIYLASVHVFQYEHCKSQGQSLSLNIPGTLAAPKL